MTHIININFSDCIDEESVALAVNYWVITKWQEHPWLVGRVKKVPQNKYQVNVYYGIKPRNRRFTRCQLYEMNQQNENYMRNFLDNNTASDCTYTTRDTRNGTRIYPRLCSNSGPGAMLP